VDPTEILVVFVTVPPKDAERIATLVVEQRVAACANILPEVRSVFRWEGRVQSEAETLLVLKTTTDGFDALAAAIRSIHPYAVPEIIGWPVARAHAPYAAWVAESVA
jgi:periplasmic divalent cation tolerance protein